MALNRTQKKGLVIIFVVAAALAAVISVGSAKISAAPLATEPNQEQTPVISESPLEVGSEEWERQIELGEKIAVPIILSDDRVAKITNGALSVHHEYYPMEFSGLPSDSVEIHVVQQSHVEGDWQTSYKYTTTGRYDINVEYGGGKVISVDVITLPDFVETRTFDDKQKEIVSMALSDAATKEKIGERTDTWITGVYSETFINGTCPYGSCHVVTIMAENSNEAFAVWVNSDTGKAVSFTTSTEWVEYEEKRG